MSLGNSFVNRIETCPASSAKGLSAGESSFASSRVATEQRGGTLCAVQRFVFFGGVYSKVMLVAVVFFLVEGVRGLPITSQVVVFVQTISKSIGPSIALAQAFLEQEYCVFGMGVALGVAQGWVVGYYSGLSRSGTYTAQQGIGEASSRSEDSLMQDREKKDLIYKKVAMLLLLFGGACLGMQLYAGLPAKFLQKGVSYVITCWPFWENFGVGKESFCVAGRSTAGVFLAGAVQGFFLSVIGCVIMGIITARRASGKKGMSPSPKTFSEVVAPEVVAMGVSPYLGASDENLLDVEDGGDRSSSSRKVCPVSKGASGITSDSLKMTEEDIEAELVFFKKDRMLKRKRDRKFKRRRVSEKKGMSPSPKTFSEVVASEVVAMEVSPYLGASDENLLDVEDGGDRSSSSRKVFPVSKSASGITSDSLKMTEEDIEAELVFFKKDRMFKRKKDRKFKRQRQANNKNLSQGNCMYCKMQMPRAQSHSTQIRVSQSIQENGDEEGVAMKGTAVRDEVTFGQLKKKGKKLNKYSGESPMFSKSQRACYEKKNGGVRKLVEERINQGSLHQGVWYVRGEKTSHGAKKGVC